MIVLSGNKILKYNNMTRYCNTYYRVSKNVTYASIGRSIHFVDVTFIFKLSQELFKRIVNKMSFFIRIFIAVQSQLYKAKFIDSF